MEKYSIRDQIVEVVNRLFIYTDQQEWQKIQSEVFAENVQFDMSSLGGENRKMTSAEICGMWEKGFQGIDSVNHLAGNFLVEIQEDTASVFAYATATHYKKSATKGNTREFVGTYDLHLLMTESGWRIDQFQYTLKYATGNIELL